MDSTLSSVGSAALRFRFDIFELDVRTGELLKGAERLTLPEKPRQLLAALLERPGEVITREELRRRLWSSEIFVDFDDNLNHAVRKVREVLGDTADRPTFIETLPRQGYRFIAAVERMNAPVHGSVERSTPSMIAGRVPVWPRWAIAGLVTLLAAGAYLSWRSVRVPSDPSARVMLAVLPLENLSAKPDDEVLNASLTEKIITELGRVNPRRLGVIARTSSMTFKGTNKSIAEIGAALRVDYVLEGGTLLVGRRVRVSLQLIRVKDQTHLWSEEYERDLDDLLIVQRAIAERTAEALSLQLLPAAQKRLTTDRVNGDAQTAFLRGRFLLAARTVPALEHARVQFQQAVDREPGFADAYAGLAEAYVLLANYNVISPEDARTTGKTAALAALAIDPSMAEARTALAEIQAELEWDFRAGERNFRQALTDNPNYAVAHQWFAAYLAAMGRFDESISEMEQAWTLDPVSLRIGVDLGRAYYFARQYDRAIAQYRKVLELDPNFAQAHSMLGMALLAKGDHDSAIAELRRGIELSAGVSIWLPYAYAVADRTDDAERALAACVDRWRAENVGASCMALAYAGRNRPDDAFAWLQKEFEARTGTIYMLNAWPYWDHLRGDARFGELLRRAGLPPLSARRSKGA